MLVKTDNQPITSRFGEAVWITDFITPENPDVVLKYQELTEGLFLPFDRVIALWDYVALLPYKPEIRARLTVEGRSRSQKDAWLYPAEVIRFEKLNCVNRSFLLTSLLKNEFPSENGVYCVMGFVNIDGIGGHAWVQFPYQGQDYVLETTQPNITKALIPLSRLKAYESKVYISDENVYTVDAATDAAEVLNARFGVCAVEFLREYLCDRCLGL